ncbi:MAG: endonuclease domain-containing protein [Oscillospiraceae bacterium]|nr:endonuclease domain-containing protein [Oscillospiraceae bacterium]
MHALSTKGTNMERNANLKQHSQQLRKTMTKEENLLWYRFLRKYPLQFRRQYVIGNYIVDFFCHKAKLVVELDGSQHYEPENQAYDRERTAYLESQGLLVLRFSNLDVLRYFPNVCEAIDDAVKRRSSAPGITATK